MNEYECEECEECGADLDEDGYCLWCAPESYECPCEDDYEDDEEQDA